MINLTIRTSRMSQSTPFDSLPFFAIAQISARFRSSIRFLIACETLVVTCAYTYLAMTFASAGSLLLQRTSLQTPYLCVPLSRKHALLPSDKCTTLQEPNVCSPAITDTRARFAILKTHTDKTFHPVSPLHNLSCVQPPLIICAEACALLRCVQFPAHVLSSSYRERVPSNIALQLRHQIFPCIFPTSTSWTTRAEKLSILHTTCATSARPS